MRPWAIWVSAVQGLPWKCFPTNRLMSAMRGWQQNKQQRTVGTTMPLVVVQLPYQRNQRHREVLQALFFDFLLSIETFIEYLFIIGEKQQKMKTKNVSFGGSYYSLYLYVNVCFCLFARLVMTQTLDSRNWFMTREWPAISPKDAYSTATKDKTKTKTTLKSTSTCHSRLMTDV
jgi:uncharacterized metal-binding protein